MHLFDSLIYLKVEVEVPTDEAIKVAANHLRGTLKSSLDDITTGEPY